MVSMARATLGNYGLAITWISYLFLLYTLLSAYISGGSDILNSLLSKIGIHMSDWQTSSLFTLLFGLIVYGGIHFVDFTNRGLMFAKLGIYILLVFYISPYVDLSNFQHGSMRYVGSSIMLLITSFGFAIIVPNLRDYFNDDIKRLKQVIIIGSLIPLVCYILWDAIIIGALPSSGNQGLESLMDNPHTTSALVSLLSQRVQNTWISALFNLFTSICMLTAFLGVSLSLYSFLADGLKLSQKGSSGLGLFLLTFLPPLFIVLYSPGIYIQALSYAGVFCVVLLLLIPALMCYFGRKNYSSSFKVPGGTKTPFFVIILSVILLIHELWQLFAHD